MPPRRPVPRRWAPAFVPGCIWRDIGVVNLPSGQPTLALTGGAKARLDAMTPAGMTAQIHLTLTDEPPLAAGDGDDRGGAERATSAL
jgi:phosphopantetheinyl transferase (holo-ACP synthase)